MFVDIKQNKEISIGKAGEYLVCSVLLKQGFDCFLSSYELPYDILAEKDGKTFKIQVKTTQKTISTKKHKDIYRFGLRHGKGNLKRFDKYDYFAFVALDIMKVAFLTKEQVLNKNQEVLQIVEFRSNKSDYYTGNERCFEDYETLNRGEEVINESRYI